MINVVIKSLKRVQPVGILSFIFPCNFVTKYLAACFSNALDCRSKCNLAEPCACWM